MPAGLEGSLPTSRSAPRLSSGTDDDNEKLTLVLTWSLFVKGDNRGVPHRTNAQNIDWLPRIRRVMDPCWHVLPGRVGRDIFGPWKTTISITN